METVTTPTAGPSAANPPAADDQSTLVKDVSSMVPVNKIDKTQARHQGGQNFLESTRLDDESAVEACLMEETRLVEEDERNRDRENSDCDLRDIMRSKKAGPSDLRHTISTGHRRPGTIATEGMSIRPAI